MTSETFSIFTTNYIESNESHTAIVSVETWTRLSDVVKSPRMFANLTFGDKSILCALSCSTIQGDFQKAIFLPEWMIPHGVILGSEYKVDILGIDALPQAEHVILRPLDSAFYNTNAKEELEQNLTRLGCLTKGQIILLGLDALGGYQMPFYVVDTLPADNVLLDGDHISCEFEESVDQFDGRPPTPIPEPAPLFNTMVEVPEQKEEKFAGEGRRLGGENKRMPDGRPWNPYREK
jgi:hypothetical protein